MDVNGTKLHLLLGEADWGRCTAKDTFYDKTRDELTLRPLPFRFPASKAVPLSLDDRRGAASDRYGNWYWIDRTRQTLLVNSAGTGATTTFWPIAENVSSVPENAFEAVKPSKQDTLLSMAGAAVTEDHYLVVGLTAPAGLLIFDLQAGGPPDRLQWPETVAFTPFDLAARPGGGVFVLDREHRRYWELDRGFQVVRRQPVPPPVPGGGFEPLAGPSSEAPCLPPEPPRDADAIALDADPIATEAAKGIVLILFRAPVNGPSTLRAYRAGVAVGPAVPIVDAESQLVVAAHDFALVPATADLLGQLFVVDQRGDQAFAFSLAVTAGGAQLTLVRGYFPMRLFGGKALVAAGGKAYYDFDDRWLPLVPQPRHKFVGTGTIVTGILDGGEPGCVWHRLLLDACLASETGVRVWSAVADDPALLELSPDWVSDPALLDVSLDWFAEPALYARGDGSELPYSGDAGDYRTLELAFQRARGRYLRLRLELDGNERSTPRLRALRAYFPRFSYLERYLPAVYREDPESASFMDRFLANFEGIYTTIEDRIAAAQVLFDPRTTPAGALDWLGRWFELTLDPAWDEAKRRLLLSHTMELFQWRGTVRGLRAALALAIEDRADPSLFSDTPGACVLRTRIVERYQTKLTPGVALGDPTQPALPAPPGNRWRPSDGATALHRRYRDALPNAPADTRFPLVPPADAASAAVWRAVALDALGFVPVPGQVAAWRDFLRRRYPRLADLAAAYQLAGPSAVTSYDQVLPPVDLPEREPALTDWFQFQAVCVRSAPAAHRFRVLLPVPAGTAGDTDLRGAAADRASTLDLVRRVVELEKPAHTVFDVKFYWEAFRLGEARLGLDTLVDLGGRSPNLLTDAVLGRSYLGESVLASPVAAVRRSLPTGGARESTS